MNAPTPEEIEANDRYRQQIYEEQKNMREIELTRGKVTIVDDDDFEKFGQLKWCAHLDRKKGKHYVKRSSLKVDGKRKTLILHREIMGAKKGEQVDHIDGDSLNNQKANLRLCSNRQNTLNRGADRGSSSRFKGVGWHKSREKWQAQIMIHGKSKHLGHFEDEVEAARAYDAGVRKYLFADLEFAVLNFPEKHGGLR